MIESMLRPLVGISCNRQDGDEAGYPRHVSSEKYIEAVIDEQTMSLRKVMELKVGETLMLNSNPESIIELKCGGIGLLAGRMGRVGPHIAVQIEDRIREQDKR